MGSVRELGLQSGKNRAEGSTPRMKDCTVLFRIPAFFLMEHLWFGSGLDCREVRCGMKAKDGEEEEEGRWAS